MIYRIDPFQIAFCANGYIQKELAALGRSVYICGLCGEFWTVIPSTYSPLWAEPGRAISVEYR